MSTVYTIGYEGVTLSDFLATLRGAAIKRVVDVRERAQSRRPGFSKSALSAALRIENIAYEHRRELGDPKPGRDAARAGRYDEFQQIFSSHMETTAAKNELRDLVITISRERCVLLCYERDYRQCHRNLLCHDLQKLASFEVEHIGVQPKGRFGGKNVNGADRHAATH